VACFAYGTLRSIKDSAKEKDWSNAFYKINQFWNIISFYFVSGIIACVYHAKHFFTIHFRFAFV
jgi:hypothetical protein